MIVKLYEENPNPRDIDRVVKVLQEGGIIILPTDTLYAFACSMQFKKSVEAIAQLKGYNLRQAKYSMVCRSLSELSEYTRPMNNEVFQLLRSCLPGPYTFIMDAGSKVPRNYQNANKTIGLRVPANAICQAIVERLGSPLICTSVRRLNEEVDDEYITDPELMEELFGKRVDLIVDGGIGGTEPSTVVSCVDGNIELIRQGKQSDNGVFLM